MHHVPTEAEKKFWWMVRDRRLGGHKFKRQHPIGSYIADFTCLEAKLIVELDGGQHAEQQMYDAKRDAYFASLGFCVVRFWNGEFLNNQEAVADQLLALLDGGKTPSPQHSPPEGERE
jgi:very-short-patch-repair endonuclease